MARIQAIELLAEAARLDRELRAFEAIHVLVMVAMSAYPAISSDFATASAPRVAGQLLESA